MNTPRVTGQPDIAAAIAWSGEAARAAANAQAALRGEPVPALLISSEAHLAEAEASPANPYGSTEAPGGGGDPYCTTCGGDVRTRRDLDGGLVHARTWEQTDDLPHPVTISWREKDTHGRFDAASPAEVAEGAEPEDRIKGVHEAFATLKVLEDAYRRHFPDGRLGPPHEDADEPGLCPAQWGEPPDTMLCSLPSGHDGNHATAEGVEWGGRWETAEPGDVTR
jgi:hypothetical protein